MSSRYSVNGLTTSQCFGPALLIVVLCASIFGCGLPAGKLGKATPESFNELSTILENPLFVTVTDREFLWNQVVDVVDDYFQVKREQPVQLVESNTVDKILVEGTLDTYSRVGSTYLEPWRRDSTKGFEKLYASLQSIRRRAEIRVIPTPGGYNLDVAVYKELEDVDRPERSTAGSATLRHDGSLVRQRDRIDGGPVTLGWIPQGRDVSLEQQILIELQTRLTNINVPRLTPKRR